MESNQYTATVYGYIKDGNYIEAVRILQVKRRLVCETSATGGGTLLLILQRIGPPFAWPSCRWVYWPIAVTPELLIPSKNATLLSHEALQAFNLPSNVLGET